MECPQCSAVMDSRVQEFDDGETLDVLECGSCGYAEWSFEGDTWRFEVTGTIYLISARARAGSDTGVRELPTKREGIKVEPLSRDLSRKKVPTIPESM